MPEINPEQLPPGTRLQEYKILETLGRGGFGITYLALDTQLKRKVAIKEYFPVEFAVRSSGQTISPRSERHAGDYQWGMDRFIEEARTLAHFDHPNIVRVIRFFEENGSAYIVMEHIVGRSLLEELKEDNTLPENRVKEIVTALLDGLQEAHDADLLHRDIKPGNVMFREDGRPVLIDFGAARSIAGQHSRTMTAVLTPGYAPIEQYGSQGESGPWTDIYSLGALAYRCLSGETPPDAVDRVRKDPMQSKPFPQVDPNFAWVIDAALMVEESERPQTIAEWRHIISLAESGQILLYLMRHRQPGPEDVQALIAAGADVNAMDKDERTPLHFVHQTQETLQVLIDAGADVDAKDEYGRTPLHFAVSNSSNPEVLQVLIDAGADVNASDESMDTPLHFAVSNSSNPEVLRVLIGAGADANARYVERDYYSDPEALQILIDTGPGPDDVNGIITATLLHMAARSNSNPEVLRVLIDAGADVNALSDDPFDSDDRDTPLHFAASYNSNPEVLRVLIDAGADVNALSGCACVYFYNSGGTPLHLAASNNSNPEVLQVLVDADADVDAKNWLDRTPLHFAASNNSNPEVLQVLIDAGADVNAMDKDERTPLHCAVDAPEALQVLIDAGADVNARDDLRRTPLHCAVDASGGALHVLIDAGENFNVANEGLYTPLHAVKKTPEALQVLIDAGANVDAKDEKGWTPLHYAPVVIPEALQVLIDAGANVDAKDEKGWTPLHFASAVRLLFDAEDVNAKDEDGWTPWHASVVTGEFSIGNAIDAADGWAPWHASVVTPEALQVLINAGADVDAEDVYGRTPLHVVEKIPEALQVLIDAGADANAKDRYGMTPLHYAVDAPGSQQTDSGASRIPSALFYGLEVPKVVQVLIAAGADVNAKDRYEATPLDYVYDMETSKLLISLGAKENTEPESRSH